MNNKGASSSFLTSTRIKINRIKDSYIYRLISKVLSVIGTLVLICLIIIGSLMFYFNAKAKAAEKRGISYVPPFGLYTIISGSMEPSIHVYDVVVSVNEKDLSKIKVGDIITFISTWDVNYGLTVTHRVASVSKNSYGEYQFTTKGDNNQDPDGAVVTQQNFVGKVVARLPYLGRLQFFLATKMGWFMVVFIPALGVIIYDMFKIFKLIVLKRQIDNVETYDDLNTLPAYNEDESINQTVEESITPEENKIEENHKQKIIPIRHNQEQEEIKTTVNSDENINIIYSPSVEPAKEETNNSIVNDVPEEIVPVVENKPVINNENPLASLTPVSTNSNEKETDEIELPVMNGNVMAPNGRKPLERRKK